MRRDQHRFRLAQLLLRGVRQVDKMVKGFGGDHHPQADVDPVQDAAGRLLFWELKPQPPSSMQSLFDSSLRGSATF